MDCVKLKERFGRVYRVTHEESYYAQYGPRAWTDDPWLEIIPGRYGHVFPHGGNLLAASSNSVGPTARKLVALPGVILWQDGSDGVTVLFPPEQLDEVAAILRLKRRRVVSEAERQRLRKLAAQYGFRPITGARGASAVCVPTAQVDQEAIPA